MYNVHLLGFVDPVDVCFFLVWFYTNNVIAKYPFVPFLSRMGLKKT